MAKDYTEWDDLLFPKVKEEATQHLVFGFRPGGATWEIALTDKHAEEFEKNMEKWIRHARATGLKMPQLPPEMRRCTDPAPLSLQLSPDGDAGKVNGKAEGKAKGNPDLSLPGGTPMPKNFWHTPGGADKAPWTVRKEFEALRTTIREWAGEARTKGQVPQEMGYAWGRAHPDQVWDIAKRYKLK